MAFAREIYFFYEIKYIFLLFFSDEYVSLYYSIQKKKMTRKRKPIEIIPQFTDLPRDIVIAILEYDDRFYLSNDGYTIISRFARKDPRYILLARIPKINDVWGYRYFGGNIYSYMIHMVFLSKNKKQRFSLAYYLDEDAVDLEHNERMDLRKVVFKNHFFSETVFYF